MDTAGDGIIRAQRWISAAGLFKCLSAPVRIGIIELLLERPRTVTELVDALAAPQPLISQHLRVLREECLVVGERSGRATTYSLMDAHVAHIVRDALAHAAEHDPRIPTVDHAGPGPERRQERRQERTPERT